MGDNTPQEDNVINLNEESRLYAEDPNGDFVAVGVDGSGNLTVTIPTGSPLATDLQEVGGQSQSAVDIAAVLDALEDALASVGTDHLLVQENSALDVSAAEIDVDIATQTLAQVGTDLQQIGGQAQSAVDVASAIDAIEDALASVGTDTLRTEQQTPVGIENTGGTQVDPATETSLTNTLSREIATWSAGTLAVEQQTPVAIENTSGTQIDPVASGDASQVSDTTTASGSANAASIDLGQVRNDVDVFYDVANNNGSIEVEVSTDNATWRPFTSVASGDIPSGGEQAFVQVDTAYRYVRAYAGGAYADADVNTIEAVTRGI